MAKRRSISISLAAKCQLLFGLAVLVIIAGALAVPWQRMEQLAVQPNVKAARLAADLYFRQIHANALANSAVAISATSAAPAAASAPAATSATAPEDFWNDIALTDNDFPPPQIYTAPSATRPFADPDAVADPVASQALALFRDKPQETDFGKVYTVTNRAGDRIRLYRYAAPIRLDASCLHCHTEYLPWVRGASTAAATRAANALSAPVSLTPAAAPASLPALRSAAIPAAWPVVGVVRVDVPYQTDENQLLLNRIVIVVAGMLGGTLAIVVFYLITSRLILQPVRVLKNTAEKVAKGDLNIRSAISTGDEFQHLSETFNTMLATLKASQDQLEATNRSLDTRVGELAQSNVDLFEANRLKSEFLTNVTHELRTPLNAILGFADLMGDAAARLAAPPAPGISVPATSAEAKLQRYSENIRMSARQLLDLINDLLDLAKIEAGKIVLREEKVNVADVCEAMANFMRPLAQKKNIDLHIQVSPDMPLVTTDAGRFQQILYNFLSNAIKFTPTDGSVTIAARTEEPAADAGGAAETAVRVAITDTGPGISPEDQKVIFDKFRQIDGSVTRQHAGTGLGLTIARELASMLGARIELASTIGKGATFSLVMPVTNPQSQPPADSPPAPSLPPPVPPAAPSAGDATHGLSHA
ncbi:MAG TPA: ATP-binding protein [Phycisphaerae bacterium]|nr:ATP-binding protein [Phycisphaerae bacterium]